MPFIPQTVYGNVPQGTVAGPGGTTAPAPGTPETWTVTVTTAFPAVVYNATQFHAADQALPGELFLVQVAPGGTGSQTWTIQRGAEGTAPVAHSAGFTVVQVVSAGDLNPYQPWQFAVQAYGAHGDAKIGTGGTGASGQAVFTDAGANFINATAPLGDIGKYIVINQGPGSATVATNPFCGTITGWNSATSVTLSANLGATCAAAPYIYGTDDAAAINAAVLAAANWAVSTGNYKAQVVFEPSLYMLGALTQSTSYTWPFNTTGPYYYNTHIPVPFSGQYARKLIIDFVGVGDSSDPDFWGCAIPSIQGSCLVSAVFPPSQPDATYGQMSVIGVPSLQNNIGNGGIGSGQYANVLVNVNGISTVTPYNSQMYGYDFRYAAQANLPNANAVAFAPVNFGAQTVGGPWLRSTNIPGNGVAVGLAMPLTDNNNNTNIGLYSCEGIAIGVLFAEHFNATRIAVNMCAIGMQVTGLPNAPINIHGGAVQYFTCEACGIGIQGNYDNSADFQFPLFIGNADFEPPNTYYVNDPFNSLTGTMYWNDIDAYSPVTGSAGINGATSYKIVNCRMYPGPWVANAAQGISAPPAAPATGVAQQNIAYRDATVYVSAGTSITGVSVGPASASLTALGLAAGAGVVIPFRVPGGHWYSVAYTGTLTVKWVLE